MRERLGTRVFGADDDTIEPVLLRMLDERGWTLGTAESATGGLIAARITSMPGASRVFRGGVVAYAPRSRGDLLGVPAAMIDQHGVVSEPVAIAMANGVAAVLRADVAVAVTGSAGPDPAGTAGRHDDRRRANPRRGAGPNVADAGRPGAGADLHDHRRAASHPAGAGRCELGEAMTAETERLFLAVGAVG